MLLKFKDHPKVERNEQIGSAAAATYAMSLAANALGFGSMWRTGLYATDPHVISALGGGDKDEVIGFLYLGTREGPSKLTPLLTRGFHHALLALLGECVVMRLFRSVWGQFVIIGLGLFLLDRTFSRT